MKTMYRLVKSAYNKKDSTYYEIDSYFAGSIAEAKSVVNSDYTEISLLGITERQKMNKRLQYESSSTPVYLTWESDTVAYSSQYKNHKDTDPIAKYEIFEFEYNNSFRKCGYRGFDISMIVDSDDLRKIIESAYYSIRNKTLMPKPVEFDTLRDALVFIDEYYNKMKNNFDRLRSIRCILN